jgi:hypothetical protein
MTLRSKQLGYMLIAVVAAITILVSAHFSIGPEHAWLSLTAVWGVLFAAFEVVAGRSNSSPR